MNERTTGEAGTVAPEQQILGILAAEDGENQEPVGDVADEAEVEQDETEAEAPEAEADGVESDELDDLDEDDEAPEPEPEPSTYQVKVDGETVEVTLDELQKGYSRQADYTRKSQALAEQRKALESQMQQLRAEREQIQQYQQQVQQVLAQQEQEPDWEREYQVDPIGAVQKERQWRAKKERQQQLLQQQYQMSLRQQQEQAQQMARMVEENRQKLPELIPAWKDQAVAAKERQQLRTFLQSHGFADSEIAQIYDPRAVALARDAMLYRAAKAKRQEMRKTAPKSTTKTVAPNAAPTQSQAQQKNLRSHRQRLAQTGRLDDAASLLERML